MCIVLGEELWSWYVDILHHRPGRIGTQQLVDQAVVIATDLQDDWSIRVAQGQADGASFPKLPVLSRDWAGRWRKAHGVTFRTVNLRYKLSQSKRLHRLRIFWSNVLRMRLLHECLYGRDGIDFVSADQKPLYFNSSLASKSLAPRGANKVNVKESVADSRERFTLMTSCPSWQVTEPPGLAICFRHGGLEAKGVTRSVLPRRGGLVQWAPKGSHRLAQVLQYLKWAVVDEHGIPQKPVSTVVPCDDPEARARARAAAGSLAEVRHLVVVLDWFAPHLDEQVDEVLEAHDVACLRIAGGLTGDVQVCDTHRHGPLTSNYRTLEGRDAQTQMRMRPSKMPSFSRQHVWDRSLHAWAETSTGVEGRLEWIQNACLNALDGTEDGKIGQDLLSIWTHLGMSAIRDQLREEIRDEVQAGRLHSFWQFHDILESYDEHPGLIEGMEDAEVHVHDDDDADSDEDDDDTPDDAKKERDDMQDLPSEAASSLGPGVSLADGSCPSALCVHESSVCSAGVESTIAGVESTIADPGVGLDWGAPSLEDLAHEGLQQNKRTQQLKALSDASALLRAAGDLASAQALDRRVHVLMKSDASVDNTTRLFYL